MIEDAWTPTPHPSPQGGGELLALHLRNGSYALVGSLYSTSTNVNPSPTADCRLPHSAAISFKCRP